MPRSPACFALLALIIVAQPLIAADSAGFVPLFNGKDLSGWKIPEGDNGHWRVVDGVIDYDALSEASGDKNLWTEKEFGDFTLMADWRITATPCETYPVPIVKPDGSHKLGPDGKEIKLTMPTADSGIYLRGYPHAQVNIWCWPIGSGEVYSYRMNKKMPPEVRAGVTPKVMADRDIGQWNTFEITMRGDRLQVVLNDVTVIEGVSLPGIPPRGPLALQHHGAFKDGQWQGPPSIVQFRNIAIKEL